MLDSSEIATIEIAPAKPRRLRNNFPVQISPRSYDRLSAVSGVLGLSRMQVLDVLLDHMSTTQMVAVVQTAGVTPRRAGRPKKSFHSAEPLDG